jgi:hypothetical protein
VSDLVPVRVDRLPADPRHRPTTRRSWRIGGLALAAAITGAVVLSVQGALGLLGLTGALGMYTAIIGWQLGRRRRAVRLVGENDDGVALLNTGDVDGAARIFDRLAGQARSIPFHHALVVYNRAIAFLRQGEPEEALRLLAAVQDSDWLDAENLPYRGLLAVGVGAACAQLGDLHQAVVWQQKAHASVSPAKRGLLVALDATIAARAGDFAAAERAFDLGWAAAEGLLPAAQMRSLKALKAFVLLHGPHDAGREAEVQRIIAELSPPRGREFFGMGARWPEMQDFLLHYALVR